MIERKRRIYAKSVTSRQSDVARAVFSLIITKNNMNFRMLILTVTFFCICVPFLFSGVDGKPEIHLTQLYHYDLRDRYQQLLVEKVSCVFVYKDKNNNQVFKFGPLLEVTGNLNKRQWQREEIGIEIGKDISPWFYLGDAIKGGWIDEDFSNHGVYQKHSYTGSVMRVLLSHAILSTKLKGFVLNEYAYEFNKGSGVCNEIVTGLIMPWPGDIESGFDWRHIDRIHQFDSDTAEVFLTLHF